jgi:hypothetical protein
MGQKKQTKKAGGVCPSDGTPLEFIGSIGICDVEGRWDSETDRYRCAEGHMIFVADREPIEEAEMLSEDDPPHWKDQLRRA